jgi:hypothetical protein
MIGSQNVSRQFVKFTCVWSSDSLCKLSRSLRLLIIGKTNVLSIISLTMDDFSLNLEVHLAMPIRDNMNVFILRNDSFLCLYSAGHNLTMFANQPLRNGLPTLHIAITPNAPLDAVRMKMSLISCYYVLRYTSKEKTHFLK